MNPTNYIINIATLHSTAFSSHHITRTHTHTVHIHTHTVHTHTHTHTHTYTHTHTHTHSVCGHWGVGQNLCELSEQFFGDTVKPFFY